MNAFHYSDVLLEASGVNLSLGGTQILRDVNLSIHNVHRPGHSQGQVVGLLGPSGVGKTQLFKILAGLSKPDSGTVTVGVQKTPVKPGMVGVVAQTYPLFEHRTVWSNLIVAGQIAGLEGSELDDKAKSLLSHFKLEDKALHYAAEISGGQRQRVAIAQQLMAGSRYLLMDEPFSGLDPVMKDQACRLIRDVAAMDELMTIVVVTHDIGSSVQISDKVWLMGRDFDDNGSPIPGAHIKREVNLAERGLAWVDHIERTPAFADCVNELREDFNHL